MARSAFPWEKPVIKTRIALIAGLAASLIAVDAIACAGSLHRMGMGVSYRTYSVPLPGSVLIYGHGMGAQQLAWALARSGHGVKLIGDDGKLKSEIDSGAYDVIIASYSELPIVRTKTISAVNAPSVLPIAQDAVEEAQARNEYKRVMHAQKHEIKHYLKAIHLTLKQRG